MVRNSLRRRPKRGEETLHSITYFTTILISICPFTSHRLPLQWKSLQNFCFVASGLRLRSTSFDLTVLSLSHFHSQNVSRWHTLVLPTGTRQPSTSKLNTVFEVLEGTTEICDPQRSLPLLFMIFSWVFMLPLQVRDCWVLSRSFLSEDWWVTGNEMALSPSSLNPSYLRIPGGDHRW